MQCICIRGVDGSSDELDRPLAALFADVSFRTRHRLGSLNSVNVARVVMRAGERRFVQLPQMCNLIFIFFLSIP